MGSVVGDLLPLAVGVAISPLPILAVVLMLLAPRAGGTSTGFLLGWVVGIVVATTIFLLLAGILHLGGSTEPSAADSWLRLGVGVLLVGLAVSEWRSRPGPGEQPPMPKWTAHLDRFTPAKAAGLGAALAAVNPKNLLLCIAAGAAVAGGGLPVGQAAASVAVFTVIASSTVAVPVIAYAVGRKRMAGTLESLRGWLTAHNQAVMATLLLVLGVALVGKALGALV